MTVEKGAAEDGSSREIVLDASRISSYVLADYFWLDFARPCVIALDFFLKTAARPLTKPRR